MIQGARARLEAARTRKPRAQASRGESRVDKLVGLLATQPLRHWYIEELVEGLPGIPGGRARMPDRERAVRATIGQTQQRGLIENTGRRRYRLTAAGRAAGSGRTPGGAASTNGSASPHIGHAITALKKEERAVSEALRKAEKTMASSRRGGRGTSARVQPGEYGTQLDQLVSVMVVRPDQEWSIDDMLKGLVAKGWKTSSAYPEQIVRNNITHALNLGLVRRVGRGKYRVRPQAHKAASAIPAKPAAKRTTKRSAGRSTTARSNRSAARGRTAKTRGPARRGAPVRGRARRTAKR